VTLAGRSCGNSFFIIGVVNPIYDGVSVVAR
jgi:hypothetical protein